LNGMDTFIRSVDVQDGEKSKSDLNYNNLKEYQENLHGFWKILAISWLDVDTLQY